jgi:hypothetical protein
MKGWHNKCVANADMHTATALKHKNIKMGLGLTNIILPIVAAIVIGIVGGTDSDADRAYSMVLLGVVSAIASVTAFLTPEQLQGQHADFASRYKQLSTEITSELIKPQRHRQAADVFIQRIMDRYNNLNNQAPGQ